MTDPLVTEVARQLGLDLDSVGHSHVDSALRLARDRALRRSGTAERNRAIEAQELLEAIVVPESWFFRDEAPFVHLARHCASEPGRVRILSAPCARGEEAWSAAMTLARSSRTPDQMDVIGIDVSERAIQQARTGVYAGMSLRGNAAALAAPWMETTPDGMRVSPTLRPAVHFEVANMAQPAPWPGVTGTFDVILCRNLLIYQTLEVRQNIVRQLRELLRPGGIVLCGHAEGSIFLSAGWTRDGAPETSSFRPPAEGAARVVPAAALFSGIGSAPPPPVAPEPVGSRHPTPSAALRPIAVPPVSAPPALDVDREVDRARAFADAGLYEDAAGILRTFLVDTPAFPDAWVLVGMCELAQNDVTAAQDAFRQALVYEPQSIPALEGMAIVAERNGRIELANSYRMRVAALRGDAP
jgi:chemotaxis protein methyltransferase WspC